MSPVTPLIYAFICSHFAVGDHGLIKKLTAAFPEGVLSIELNSGVLMGFWEDADEALGYGYALGVGSDEADVISQSIKEYIADIREKEAKIVAAHAKAVREALDENR